MAGPDWLGQQRRKVSRAVAAGWFTSGRNRRLVCPIGIDGVEGKAPSIIAISVAAQLLQTMKAPAEVALPREMRVVTPLARDRAFGDCTAENCDSCGTRRRASV